MTEATTSPENAPAPRPGAAPSSTWVRRLSTSKGLRLLATLPTCYAFTWGLVAFGIAALVAGGVDYHEAETAMMLLGFAQFVPLFLWAFASKQPGRVWTILVGGAAGLPAAAWALQRALLP